MVGNMANIGAIQCYRSFWGQFIKVLVKSKVATQYKNEIRKTNLRLMRFTKENENNWSSTNMNDWKNKYLNKSALIQTENIPDNKIWRFPWLLPRKRRVKDIIISMKECK